MQHTVSISICSCINRIHIRRTDKVGTEAAFHSIDEYMTFVTEWYDAEDMKRQRLGEAKIPTRAVFIASDDPNVHSEAVERFVTTQSLCISKLWDQITKLNQHL